MRPVSTFAAIAFIASTAIFAGSSAQAMSPQLDKEIAAAASHAGYAAAGGDVGTVRMHLHHTINCLVGPDGKGFAPKEMNPCAALGNGALNDTSDKGTLIALEAALSSANVAIEETDLEKAKAGATAVQSMLIAIQ
mgnify:CR=1 FL=1